MTNNIVITGARQHNLKNIDLTIPKNSFVVVTGISGSGKSTLAFDTLYSEGQRRYIESLSSYARQFLGKLDKPDVDKIDGLTPAIAIDQKTTSKNPRSTVGTITEIYDYLRLLYARVGVQHCHKCHQEISHMNTEDIINQILLLPEGTKLNILSPIVNSKKGAYADVLESLRAKGYVRAMIDGVMVRLDEDIDLKKTKLHTIKIVVDRVVIKPENKQRISDDIEKALKESFGVVELDILNHEEVGLEPHKKYSEHFACFDCKISYEELEPLSFSFNSPKGACKSCDGLGIKYTLDMNKIIDEDKTINDGAIKILYGFNKSYYAKFLNAFCEQNGIDTTIPFKDLEAHNKKLVLNGAPSDVNFTWKKHRLKKPFEGVKVIAYSINKDEKDMKEYMVEMKCDVCDANRLNASSLAVKVANEPISQMINLPIEEVYKFFSTEANFAHLSSIKQQISLPILKELKQRLYFLFDVGLGYLSLGRDARSISGGEAQRIRIASQIGSGLTGVMYVLDEPSIGLHEKDTFKLIKTLKNLKDKGNTLIVVEHDEETIKAADYIIDIGPGAGKYGGDIVFAGTYKELQKAKTQTADYLFGRKKVTHLHNRPQKKFLKIDNVTINNINKLNLKIPLNNFVAVTGVSGSGKSSLILQVLLPAIKNALGYKNTTIIKDVKLSGYEGLDKVIYLDQSPIGKTSRSNPATYTGIMDDIRDIFSQTKLAKIKGYKIGRFSFNVTGGRCEKCKGEGELKISMHFLPDVIVNCDLCNGHRYNTQTLEVLYKGKNISDVLNMSVNEAYEFFKAIPKLHKKLKVLKDVGLDYITLGQNAVTLSGGEAQRIKLSRELSKNDTGKTLYILDEPTTGLHFSDVDRLTGVLHHLVTLGNSMIVIEHNLDVVKNADYVIDMGPDGGNKGGTIVDAGTVKDLVSRVDKSGSYTAKYLNK
ncbi:MAG: Excinuclease ABC subunit A [uncultured Campylobacterales bacterium]|uniref:UvrABC system protein A n=1 Tax=uncultured Campylobacterales bacterium TaxID=352960 RepID=A0A6S6SMG8_9BACT|nr:MAG: Excinuclease ABC subunit A [uncultured Campylobacterales bacterium]